MEYTQTIILTEGESDAALLDRVLSDDVKAKSRVITSRGYSSMISMAKSILVKSDVYIMLIMDSDTTNKSVIEDKKKDILYLFASIGKREHVRIFFFVPEMEVVFFENEEFRDKHFDEEQYSKLLIGQHPRSIVKESYANVRSFLTKLSPNDIQVLKKSSQIKELLNDIKEYIHD